MKTVRSICIFCALVLAACGTSSDGGSPDGGNAGGVSGGEGGSSGNGGSAGHGGSSGTAGDGGSSGSAGDGGSSGNAGNGGSSGNAGNGGSPDMDASVPNDAGSDDAGTGGGEVDSARVFYFGHSLVGHDMPQMIGAFARARSKTYAVNGQIGFGTSIQSHWRWEGGFDDGFVPIGFSDELPGSLLFDIDGHAALESGDYGVIVLTETNDFAAGSPGNWNEACTEGEEFGGCSIEMAANIVRKARMHNAGVRTLLYTNWKDFAELGGIDNWLDDIAANAGYWENIADKVEAQLAGEGAGGSAIQVVPGARVIARIVREARDGQLDDFGINDHSPLFADTVHLSRLGFYVIALTHYAAIFRDTPVGLPHTVDVASGDKSALEMNGFEVEAGLATYLQNAVWEELLAYPRSGVSD